MTTPSERFDIVKRAAEAGHFREVWQAYCATEDYGEEEAQQYLVLLDDVEALLGERLETLEEAVTTTREVFCATCERYAGVKSNRAHMRASGAARGALAPRFA